MYLTAEWNLEKAAFNLISLVFNTDIVFIKHVSLLKAVWRGYVSSILKA